ncbi:MAG TPA: hypothetical protein VFJ14_02120 [Nocardioidaceae bacterium]|nr:hypothetical protein [Nocardioidaceae bacterium]
MSPTVHLHIGAPKSGTSYLQAALVQNQRALADDGVLFPGRLIDHIRAAEGVLGAPRLEKRWDQLAEKVRSFDGAAAVISMELLCTATPRQARRAVAAFDGLDVRVVLTARDLARVIPAQWQESTQFRHTWSFQDYLAGVTARRPRQDPAGRSFWRQHDLDHILGTWSGAVGADHVTVVTLPQRTGEPDLLWRRFSAAVGIESGRYELPATANESLGAASAELMRRVNEALAGTDLGPREYARNCRQLLAKTVLAARSREEPRLALPGGLQPWAAERSAQAVAAIRDRGVQVVGDLDDLRSPEVSPTRDGGPPGIDRPDVDPAQLPPEALLDAAVDAIAGLVTLRVDQERRRRSR